MCSISKQPRFCDEVPLEFSDCSGITLNQALAGVANDRTKVKPSIIAPIADLRYWSADPTISYSQINSRSTKYPRLSGWEMSAIPQQPGIYTMTEMNQPINSTNGIAITPQFPEHTYLIKGQDNKIYYDTNLGINYVLSEDNSPSQTAVSHPMDEMKSSPTGAPHPVHEAKTSQSSSSAPKGIPAEESGITVVPTNYCGPNIYNMYDPRQTGFGSDNRCYLDERLGQTRYFYEDIDAIKMPQYITRNKLDSSLTPFGNAYGDVDAGTISLEDARRSAETSWLDNSIAFREDLMLKLMRKRNEEQIQKRVAPKRTYGTIRSFGY